MEYPVVNDLLQHLEFLRESTWPPKAYYRGEEKNLWWTQRFALILLERLHAACIGLIALVPQIPAHPKLTYAAGLTTRASLLDFLIGLYAHHMLNSGDASSESQTVMKETVEEYCKRMLADGLVQSLKYAQRLVAIGAKTAQQRDRGFANYAKKYSWAFQPYDGEGNMPEPRFKKAPQAAQLFEQLYKTKEVSHLSLYYDPYLYFSKFEHFGIESSDVMNDPVEVQLKFIRRGVEMMLRHNFFCYSILLECVPNDEMLANHFEQAAEQIHLAVKMKSKQ